MTKHYYADSQRIASSIVDWDESANVVPSAFMGGSDFSEQRQTMQKQLQDVLVDLGMEEDFVVMSATTCDDELQDILHNLELQNMDRCLDWILDLIDKGNDSCTIIKYYDNSDCLLEDCKEEMEGWLGYFEQNNMDGCLTKLNYYILNSGLTDCAILEELKSTTDCYTIRTEVACYEEFMEQYWYCYNSTDVDCLLNFEKLLEEFKSYCELIEIIRQGPHYNPNPVPDPEETYPEVEEPEVEPEAPEDEVVVIPNEPVIPEQPHISGKIWWYHSDHLGSSSYLTDINGIPTHYYGYLPFGELMVEHNNSNYNNVYKFNGKELDEKTGFYYYGARYYDPVTSIFLSVDPLAEQFPGWNPYHYVHNNPINLIDPTGMAADGWRENHSTGEVKYDESYTSENTPDGYTYFDAGTIGDGRTMYNADGTHEPMKEGTLGCVDCHHDVGVGGGSLGNRGALERSTLWGENRYGGEGGKSYRGQLVKSFSFDSEQFPLIGVGGASLRANSPFYKVADAIQTVTNGFTGGASVGGDPNIQKLINVTLYNGNNPDSVTIPLNRDQLNQFKNTSSNFGDSLKKRYHNYNAAKIHEKVN